jgi:hypothetical protein
MLLRLSLASRKGFIAQNINAIKSLNQLISTFAFPQISTISSSMGSQNIKIRHENIKIIINIISFSLGTTLSAMNDYNQAVTYYQLSLQIRLATVGTIVVFKWISALFDVH